MEVCRSYPIERMVCASSSSVYGINHSISFSEKDISDKPVSLYTAAKKSNELMAYSYSKLYGISATGLRLFTVYGPYGRPDMAYFRFTKSIVNEEPIKVYNGGNMYRNFTYIDDVVNGIEKLLCNPPHSDEEGDVYRTYANLWLSISML